MSIYLSSIASNVISGATGATGPTGATGLTGSTGALPLTTPFTANGVVYASSTSALATGSALTFDGTTVGVFNGTTVNYRFNANRGTDDTTQGLRFGFGGIDAYRTGVALSSSQTPISFTQTGSNGTRTPLYIDTTGYVGVGTTSPSSLLHIASSGPTIIMQNTTGSSGNGVLRWQGSGGTNQAGIGSYYNIADTGNIEFLNSGATNMVLTSAGALVIGSTSAATSDSKLNTYINSAGSFLTLAEFRNIDYTSGTRSFIRVRNGVTSGSSVSAYFGQGQDNKLYIIANNSARGGDLVIDGSSGYVGIGTSSPSYALDVVGSFQTTRTDSWSGGFMNHSQFLAPNMTGGGLSVGFGKSGSTYNLAKFVFNYVGSGSSSNYIGLGFWDNDNILNIQAAGKVGIGTTSPFATLHVGQGSIISDQQSSSGTSRTIYASQGTAGTFYTCTITINLGGPGGWSAYALTGGTAGMGYIMTGGYTNQTGNFSHNDVTGGAGSWSVTSTSNDVVKIIWTCGGTIHPVATVQITGSLSQSFSSSNLTIVWS